MSKSPAPFDHGVFLTHLQKGKEFFDQDDLQKARQELEAAYYLRPQDEKVLNMLGMTYYKLEMLPEAEAMYVVLAAGNPDVYALQSNLGLIQMKLHKLTAARESLNRALELQPTNSKAHFYMGLLCEKEERWDDALYHFEQANAVKMVTKMQAKMEEARNNPGLVLPFQVVEVIEPSAAEDVEPELPNPLTEQMAELNQDEPDAEITGRMRAQDLAEAMFQVHQEAIAQSAEPEMLSEEGQYHEQEEVQPVFIEPQGPLETPGEEMMQKDASESMADRMEEEIRNEGAEWEKTHPSLFPPQFGENETVADTDSTFLIGSAVDEPFLLSDDIAADISTFLAQTITEENPEEDVFYSEPTVPELTIIRGSEPEPSTATEQEQPQELRIPTPEEVESAVAETPIDPIARDASLLSELAASLKMEESLLTPPAEQTVEELPLEVSREFEQTAEAAISQELQDQEEELEVNFAVTDSEEEEPAEQGFLEPSPLTPDFAEEQLEQTQDMADTMPPPSESKTLEVEPPSVEPAPESVVAVDVDLVLEPAAQAEEEETVPEKPQEAEPQQQPEITSGLQDRAELSEPHPPATPEPAVATFHPVNLDQFSKDRHYIQPLIGSDRFLLIDPHLLEIIISDKLICRKGTISSYTGNLQFLPITEQTKDQLKLIQVTGTGILFLADRRKEIFLISLNNEVMYVESNHLLVAQSSLQIEPQFLQQKNVTGDNFAVIKVSGRGTLALTCQTKPLTVNVNEGLPANIPAQAVIAWSGNVVSEVLEDANLRKIMMPSDEDSLFLRFHGAGDVVVEQGSLWGDRRSKRI